MATYLKLVMELISTIEKFESVQILHSKNSHADALSKLASSKDSELFTVVPIEHLQRPSTSKGEDGMWVEDTSSWMKSIVAFIKDQTLPSDKEEDRSSEDEPRTFFFQDDVMYKQSFSLSLL